MAVEVVEYDPRWPGVFSEIASHLRDIVGDRRIEHVGSTSIPGLPAKPVIDVDIVINSAEEFPSVKGALESAGYLHRGNLGIIGREMFSNPEDSPWGHFHLYVCMDGSLPLQNHLLFRDRLRNDAVLAEKYAQLKRHLAETYSDNIALYTQSKTEFILKVLAEEGMDDTQLNAIDQQNKS